MWAQGLGWGGTAQSLKWEASPWGLTASPLRYNLHRKGTLLRWFWLLQMHCLLNTNKSLIQEVFLIMHFRSHIKRPLALFVPITYGKDIFAFPSINFNWWNMFAMGQTWRTKIHTRLTRLSQMRVNQQFYWPRRHLHISHNAPYLPQKILQSIVFNFSWDSYNTLEKWKTKVTHFFFWGGGGADKVHYGWCASGVYENFYKININIDA